MSHYQDERQAIETTFRTAWIALQGPDGPAPVEMQNHPFDRTAVEQDNWGRLLIMRDTGEQIGLGDYPYHRFEGMIVLYLRAPRESGTESLLQLADQFLTIWKTVEGKPLSFEAASSGRIQTATGYVTDDGIIEGFFQVRAIVPFRRTVLGA
jgi:hypothetical protein